MTNVPVRFEDVIDRHHDELHAYLWRMLDGAAYAGATVQVEDLMQDVFARAYRAYPRLRADSNVRAWLYKIATNCALTLFKRGRNDAPLEAFEESLGGNRAEQPHYAFSLHETLDAMRAAILDLPPAQQAALVMRYLQELEYAEIAAALECSEESARANVSHAVRRLRRVLAPDLLAEME